MKCVVEKKIVEKEKRQVTKREFEVIKHRAKSSEQRNATEFRGNHFDNHLFFVFSNSLLFFLTTSHAMCSFHQHDEVAAVSATSLNFLSKSLLTFCLLFKLKRWRWCDDIFSMLRGKISLRDGGKKKLQANAVHNGARFGKLHIQLWLVRAFRLLPSARAAPTTIHAVDN